MRQNSRVGRYVHIRQYTPTLDARCVISYVVPFRLEVIEVSHGKGSTVSPFQHRCPAIGQAGRSADARPLRPSHHPWPQGLAFSPEGRKVTGDRLDATGHISGVHDPGCPEWASALNQAVERGENPAGASIIIWHRHSTSAPPPIRAAKLGAAHHRCKVGPARRLHWKASTTRMRSLTSCVKGMTRGSDFSSTLPSEPGLPLS